MKSNSGCMGWPLILVLLASVAAIPGTSLNAQVNGSNNLKALQNRISVSWSDVPLGQALANFSASQEIPVFLDRRVDPGQTIQWMADETPCGEALYQVADQIGCGVVWLGPVAYFGPLDQVATLHLLRQEILDGLSNASRQQKEKLLSPVSTSWDRLSSPVDLLHRQLARLGVAESDLNQPQNQLPHDLWEANRIPSIRPVDQLLLTVFGFGLCPNFESGRWAGLSDVPDVGESSMNFRVTGLDAASLMQQLESRVPDAKVVRNRNQIQVDGSPAAIYRARRTVDQMVLDSGTPRRSTAKSGDANPEMTRVSGRVRGKLESALKVAARELGVELEYNASLRDRLQQQIDVMASKITYEELVQLVLEGTELDYELSGNRLTISEKE